MPVLQERRLDHPQPSGFPVVVPCFFSKLPALSATDFQVQIRKFIFKVQVPRAGYAEGRTLFAHYSMPHFLPTVG